MSVSGIMIAVAELLGTAAHLAEGIGDVVTAKKVRAILEDADFPAFARRAAKAGDKAREALEPDKG